MKPVYDRRTTFVAMDGTEIHFKPFSWLEYENALENKRKKYRERGEQIDKPQYTVTFASGSQQTFDHDEKSILQAPKDTPPEDVPAIVEQQKKQWQAWKETSEKFDKEGNDLLWDFIRNDSLADLKLPADNSWEEKQRRRDVEIPDDPEEKLMHYLNTVLLKSTADRLELMETIVLVSRGMIEEAHLDTAKRLFRNKIWSDGLERLERWDAVGKTENPQDREMDGEHQPDDTARNEVIRD